MKQPNRWVGNTGRAGCFPEEGMEIRSGVGDSQSVSMPPSLCVSDCDSPAPPSHLPLLPWLLHPSPLCLLHPPPPPPPHPHLPLGETRPPLSSVANAAWGCECRSKPEASFRIHCRGGWTRNMSGMDHCGQGAISHNMASIWLPKNLHLPSWPCVYLLMFSGFPPTANPSQSSTFLNVNPAWTPLDASSWSEAKLSPSLLITRG